jgi:hypothetical protein
MRPDTHYSAPGVCDFLIIIHTRREELDGCRGRVGGDIKGTKEQNLEIKVNSKCLSINFSIYHLCGMTDVQPIPDFSPYMPQHL